MNERQEWEYYKVRVDADGEPLDAYAGTLDGLGMQGWELVGVLSWGSWPTYSQEVRGGVLFFKRLVAPES